MKNEVVNYRTALKALNMLCGYAFEKREITKEDARELFTKFTGKELDFEQSVVEIRNLDRCMMFLSGDAARVIKNSLEGIETEI